MVRERVREERGACPTAVVSVNEELSAVGELKGECAVRPRGLDPPPAEKECFSARR